MNKAFTGDEHIWDEFLLLVEKYSIESIVETGTHLADTTVGMATLEKPVYSIESKKQHFEEAKENVRGTGYRNIHLYLGDSPKVLSEKILPLQKDDKRVLYFLDAHCYNDMCLERELDILADHYRDKSIKPVIIIHDVKNPDHPNFRFDSYNGKPYSFDWIKPKIESLYGKDYVHYYNDKIPKHGLAVGCVFIVPKLEG